MSDNDKRVLVGEFEEMTKIVEEKEYDVTATITFRTRVRFSPMERDGAITADDALDNFYGYGLSTVLSSGEYECTVDSVNVKEA